MIHLAVLASALALTAGPSQDPAPRPPDEIRRLEKWPELERSVLEQVRVDVQRLRKARTSEMAEEADAGLRSAGAGAVPEILPALGKERGKEARARIEHVLLELVAPEHTRLLVAWFEDDDAVVRTFVLERCGAFPDEGVRAPAEAALARVRKKGDKADPEELYAAALAVTASGSLEGFDVLADTARANWVKRGEAIRVALEAVRGREASEKAVPLLKGERDDVLAGLELLAGCGDSESVPQVKRLLDSDDHQVRVAAINAMRGIVDGDPPVEKLPVFEAIELAKKWKTRG